METLYRLSDFARDGHLEIDRRKPSEPLAAYLQRALPQMQAKLGLITFNQDYDTRQLERGRITGPLLKRFESGSGTLDGIRNEELQAFRKEILDAAGDSSMIRKLVALNSSYGNRVPILTALMAGVVLYSSFPFYRFYLSLPPERQNLFGVGILGVYLTLISLPALLFRRLFKQSKAEMRVYGFDPTDNNIKLVTEFNSVLHEIDRQLR